jgi:hypothetical protein
MNREEVFSPQLKLVVFLSIFWRRARFVLVVSVVVGVRSCDRPDEAPALLHVVGNRWTRTEQRRRRGLRGGGREREEIVMVDW